MNLLNKIILIPHCKKNLSQNKKIFFFRMISKFVKRHFSTLENIKNVGVLGAGQMGTGIGIVLSKNAHKHVKIVDASEEQLSKSRKFTENLLDKEISKQRLTSDDKYKILERMSFSIKVEDFNSFRWGEKHRRWGVFNQSINHTNLHHMQIMGVFSSL